MAFCDILEPGSLMPTALATKHIEIGTERLCSCPPTHINCMTAKEWLKSQLGVWEFFYEGRDIRDKELHPATFPISLATHVIKLLSHEGTLVVDPFVGSGMPLVVAEDVNGEALGLGAAEQRLVLGVRGRETRGFTRSDDLREAVRLCVMTWTFAAVAGGAWEGKALSS